jgi:hypothetical protein
MDDVLGTNRAPSPHVLQRPPAGDWGPRRVTECELRAGFDSGWRIESLVADRFHINPGLGTPTAEVWLADIVRLAPQ